MCAGAHPQQRRPGAGRAPGAARPRGGSAEGTICTALVDAAGDDRLAFAVEDLPARRGDRQVAHAVGVGLLDVLFAGEHLQVPQAEEDDRRTSPSPAPPRIATRSASCGETGHRAARGPALERARSRSSLSATAGSARRSCSARRRRRRGSSGRPPIRQRRTSTHIGSATIVLTSTPSTIWRSSSKLTGASTPSMNSISE